jgi:hypothetical protein
MISRQNCKFRYYYKDKLVAYVEIDNGKVTTVDYVEGHLDRPFGMVPDDKVDRTAINLFFERHCVPEHRTNIKDFLEEYGLEKFDAFKICRITNGRMADNHYSLEWVD